jgi:hypothetical protein
MKGLIPCAMLLALAACPFDSTGPGDDRAVLRFSHTAAGTLLPAGTYEAEGEVRIGSQGQLQPGEWVFAMVGIPPSLLRVTASRRSAIVDGRYDLVLMELPLTLQAGASVPVFSPCVGSPDCAQVQLGVRAQGNLTPEMTCGLDGGTATVTARSDTRIQGTFSGPGNCFAPGASAPFQVTGGTFDVPILDFD